MSRANPAALSALPAAAAREFDYGPADFARVRRMIHARAGIALAESKEAMVYSRLSRRLRACGIERFRDYLDALEQDAGQPEWEQFVNALTTNLTSFFREPHHFPVLVRHLRSLRRNRPLRVWSCASSTGEEPYSIAMAVAQEWGSASPPLEILATDLDTRVLATAEAGIYDQERLDKLTHEQLHRHFLRGTGPNAGKARVRPELRALMSFQPLNLLASDWPTLPSFDAIFCRNVMIYFDKPTQYQVLQKLARLLEPDGLLFVGHSESLLFASDLFRLRSQTVYERVKAVA
ncbi:CheR family methyltransferase [uncultured Pseudacidovorax sp.]|uniref:CheR family methyltransferase n=1 Tax=uncultured Pseudacidovorax sp. TaxID=679313 RepID=UPI0025F75B67|nr:CheR family methyltransferase [uncultured Pseudacidovorax sp.]